MKDKTQSKDLICLFCKVSRICGTGPGEVQLRFCLLFIQYSIKQSAAHEVRQIIMFLWKIKDTDERDSNQRLSTYLCNLTSCYYTTPRRADANGSRMKPPPYPAYKKTLRFRNKIFLRFTKRDTTVTWVVRTLVFLEWSPVTMYRRIVIQVDCSQALIIHNRAGGRMKTRTKGIAPKTTNRSHLVQRLLQLPLGGCRIRVVASVDGARQQRVIGVVPEEVLHERGFSRSHRANQHHVPTFHRSRQSIRN